ncbi:MAG: 30S ribosomal protein S6e [Candidatus Heimdallarchaeota archaeon]|nr:30S ribosomal protein S6e [Candidatus Heimdallarchaeota archaeon]
MADKTILNIGKKDGTTSKFILENEKREPLYGLKIGDVFEGDILGEELTGYKFKISGGSDDDGVPLRQDLEGTDRKKILFKARTVGYKPKKGDSGIRKRKLVRGSEIQFDVVQLNVKVIEEGSNPLE